MNFKTELKKHLDKINGDYFYLLIFLIPLVFNPFGYTPYEIPKIAFLMIIASFGITLLVLHFFLGRKIVYSRNVFIIIALWIFSFGLSTIFSISPKESFWGLYSHMSGFLTYIYYFLHFFICFQILKEKRIRSVFYNLVLIIGSLISIYAIFQFIKIEPFSIGNIDLFVGRSYSTIGQPNMLGQWLIFPFFISLFYSFKKHLGKNRLFYILIFILHSGALITTFNRATFLAIFITLILLGLFHLNKKYKKISGLIILILIIIFSVFLLNSSSRSIKSRLVLWEESIPLISNNLILGSGPETYYQTIQPVLSKEIYEYERIYDKPDRIHNETYQILLDQGLIGLTLYLLLIIFLTKLYFEKRIKTFDAQISFYILVASFLSLQLSFKFSAQLIYMFGFWAILLHEVVKINLKSLKVKSSILKVFIILVLISGSLFTFVYGQNIVKADSLFNKGTKLYFEDKIESFEIFKQTISLNPNNAYYNKSTIGLFSNKDFLDTYPDVINDINLYQQELAQITNKSFEYYLVAAKFNAAIGNDLIAEKYFNKSIQKAPLWALTWQSWGEYLFENERFAESIEKFEKIIEISPDFIWTQDEQNRIFKKSNPLFYFATDMLYRAYFETNQIEKAKSIEPLLF